MVNSIHSTGPIVTEPSSKSNPTRDSTFKDARSALENAKKLYAKGEISKADFKRLEAKLGKQGQSEELNEYLSKTYVRRR